MIDWLEAARIQLHRLASDRWEGAVDFKVVNGMVIAQNFAE